MINYCNLFMKKRLKRDKKNVRFLICRSQATFNISVFTAALLLFFMPLGLFSQGASVPATATIKGVVIEEGSELKLPVVSVMVVGTTRGANTDLEGRFEIPGISLAKTNYTVRFTYIGYETYEMEVNLKPGLNDVGKIVLKENQNVLSEAVVTAFGVSKNKRVLGYSVQTLDGDEILKAREPNPIQGLSGKIAGLNIGTNAEMLSQPNVVLRGNTGIMYVVDGIPINSDTWNIPSDDIETYTVLKGPNAAALYGFRGQNGAILITTKSGSQSKKGYHIEVNSSLQVNSGFLSAPYFQTEYGNGNNYRYAYGNDELDRDGRHRRDPIWGPRFEGQLITQYDSPVKDSAGIAVRQGTPWVARGKDNWSNFTRTGYLMVNNASVAASTDKTDYRFSFSNTQQVGVYPNTGMQISNFHLSGGHKITNRLRVKSMLNANFQDSDNIPDAFYGPQSYLYDFGVYGSASYDVNDLKDYWLIEGVQQRNREYGRTNNPWFIANEWLRGHRKRDMYGYALMAYDVNPYAKLQYRTQFTMWDAARTERMPYSAENYGRPDRAGDYMEDKRDLFESNNDLLYTYDRTFGDFHVNGLLGLASRNFSYNSSWTRTNNLIVPGVYNFSNSQNPPINYNFSSNMLVLMSYYSVDLAYKEYLRVGLTGHVDKLSTLPADNNTYFYPSATISTTPSDYVKMPKFISFMKVRGTVAEVQGGLVNVFSGPAYTNLNAGRPFQYGGDWISSYDGPSYQNQNTYRTSLVYNNQPGAFFTNIVANPELQPFNVRAYELGTDVLFLKNRLGLDFTFFRTLNGPQIFVRDIAPSTGHYQTNINDVVTRKDGFEVSLTGTPVLKKDFKWDVLVNYASFVEKFHEINDPSGTVFLRGNFYAVGDRVDEAFGIAYVRDQSGEVIHGKDGLPVRRPSGPQGNTSLGFGNNRFAWTFRNKFDYKNWGLGIQFDGRVGGSIFNELKWAQHRGGTHPDLAGDSDYGKARLEEWNSLKETGTLKPAYVSQGVKLVNGTIKYDTKGNITNWEELEFEKNDVPAQLQPYIVHISGFSEPWIQSKTFTMLREVVLTYALPSKYFSQKKIEGINISLVGRNLLYFSPFKEINMDQYPGDNLRPGVGERDSNNPRLQSPTTRSFGINLNVKF